MRRSLCYIWGRATPDSSLMRRATDVLWRKASTNLHSFTDNPLALLVPVALAMVLVLLRRGRFGERWPMVAATLTAATIGLLVNDSGATVPAMAMTLAVPLTVALRPRDGTPSGSGGQPSQRIASARATSRY